MPPVFLLPTIFIIVALALAAAIVFLLKRRARLRNGPDAVRRQAVDAYRIAISKKRWKLAQARKQRDKQRWEERGTQDPTTIMVKINNAEKSHFSSFGGG